MSALLCATAAVAVAWAILLVVAPQLLGDNPPSALTLVLGYSLAATQAILAVAFLRAARNPARDLFTCGLAIALVSTHVVVDLWGLLGTLPPTPSFYFLIDLIVAFALLVGLLEALPRTVAALPQADARDEAS